MVALPTTLAELDQRGNIDLVKHLSAIASKQKSITVTVTELADYRRCKRRWNMGSLHRNNLTKIVPNKALSLGTAIHHALAQWAHDSGPNGLHPAIHYMAACDTMIERAKQVYAQQMGFAIMDAQLQELYDIVTLGKCMMENYVEYWKQPTPAGFSIIGYEQKAIIPIPGTPHFLQGRLDGIVCDTHNQLYVLEHKTYNSRVRDAGLRMLDQFCAYTWMLTQLQQSGLWDMPVAGVAYDGMWKRATPPKGKTLDDLFVRINIPFTPDHLHEYELFLMMQAVEMAGEPFIYTNRTWDARCTWDCSYVNLCDSITRDEDWQYVLKSEYTQREDDTVEDFADDPEMR